MQILSKKYIITLIVLFFSASLVYFTWNRLFYSVDITDESFYISETIPFCSGLRPFRDVWGATIGSSLISSVLTCFYRDHVSESGYEGVVLFMRQMYFLFKLSISLLAYGIIKKHTNKIAAFGISMAIFTFAPFSTYTFSYNTISLNLLLLVGLLSLNLFSLENSKCASFIAATSGVLSALLAFTYPPYVLICAYLFLAYLAESRTKLYDKTSGKKYLYYYIAGGLFIFVLLTLSLSIKAGGINYIFVEAKANFLSPYYKIPRTSMMENVLTALKQLKILTFFFVALFLVYFYNRITNRQIGSNIKKNLSFSLVVSFPILLISILIKYTTFENTPLLVCYSLFILTIINYFLVKTRSRNARLVILFLLLPSLVALISTLLASPASFNVRTYVLVPAVPAFFIVFYNSIEEHIGKGVLVATIVFIYSLIIATIFCVSHLRYVYRDQSTNRLVYKMPSGIFKGLYTTKDRGESLVRLEEELKSIINRNDKVLILDKVPAAYIMADARMAAPTSWTGGLYYPYGFNDESYLTEYFQSTGIVPDKIIYIRNTEYGSKKILSIEDSSFIFNRFVQDNYLLRYINDSEYFDLSVYERRYAGNL